MAKTAGETVQIPVESSLFESIAYSQEGRVLAVVFRGGAVMRYIGVPPKLFKAFQAAPSKAKFFHQKIWGKFIGEKLKSPVIRTPAASKSIHTPPHGECPACGDTGRMGEPCDDCGCAAYAGLR